MLTDAAIQWAGNRKISRATLETFGVASGVIAMPQLQGRKAEVMCFPYARGDTVVNTKYRTFPEKLFRMKDGGELRLFNLDAALSGPRKIAYIFEGEMDALAAFEAGLPRECVLSVPNGAPEKKSDAPEEQDRYRFIRSAIEEGLLSVQDIVLVTDNDGPGTALKHDLAHLIGAARCWFIDWPAGIKDANEALEKWGAGELRDYLEGEPKPWPVEGLFRMSEIPEPPPIETWNPGFPEWENKLLFAPGMLTVLTGHPGHGKTLLAMQLWANIARDYGVKVAVASFETNAKPHHRKNLRQFYCGAPQAELTEGERKRADEWIDDHFIWIAHPERRPSLRWYLDLAEVAVVRHRCRIIAIDPWNKLEWERADGKRETDWIRDGLNECMSFAKDMGVLFKILCHPAKRQGERSRDNYPELEDISGSKHWHNIVDQGLSVFRPKIFDNGERRTDAVLYHLKKRFDELGHECALDVNYDLKQCRFVSADYVAPPTYEQQRRYGD